ncbi:MAG: hypothetical protein CM1200mP31_0880 [Candidatus Neomarinimicrobiota bacterium]|nr:MAG: hypothetical protein CM1200mP31_0880 [Candidatus Neomarinimicrobiota bacterium]
MLSSKKLKKTQISYNLLQGKKEVLGFLKQDLSDLCISRPKTRLEWGIEIPFDKDYVTYVWFDALINYISAPKYSEEINISNNFGLLMFI